MFTMQRKGKHVSIEMKHEIVRLYMDKNFSVGKIRRHFDGYYAQSTISRILKEFKWYGSFLSRSEKARGGPRLRLTLTEESFILDLAKTYPHWYLDEYQRKVLNTLGKRLALSTIHRLFRRYGYSRKKLERDARQRHPVERALYKDAVGNYDPEHLVFIDESHMDDRDARRRCGLAVKGERSFLSEVLSRGNPRSVIAAMDIKGFIMEATVIIEQRGVDSNVLLQWAKTNLVPQLGSFPGPRSVVVADNASIHHADGFKKLIESAGARLLYLPPYSPDFNPIEKGFSKVKAYLKGILGLP